MTSGCPASCSDCITCVGITDCASGGTTEKGTPLRLGAGTATAWRIGSGGEACAERLKPGTNHGYARGWHSHMSPDGTQPCRPSHCRSHMGSAWRQPCCIFPTQASDPHGTTCAFEIQAHANSRRASMMHQPLQPLVSSQRRLSAAPACRRACTLGGQASGFATTSARLSTVRISMLDLAFPRCSRAEMPGWARCAVRALRLIG